MIRQRTSRFNVGLLALVAYLPTFLIQHGKVFTDTKLYLGTNPSALIRSATTAWDSQLFAGYVPHQNIGYLWPSGPFFWLGDYLNLPIWITQRLWTGSLFFLAVWGVYRVCQRLGISGSSSVIGALSYMLTPFVLSYVTRSSVLLLPWVGLGHIVAAALQVGEPDSRGSRLQRWRTPSVIALIVMSVGGINATALIMIAPAPAIAILMLIHWGVITRRVAAGFLLRTTALCALVSAWWLSAVAVQARFGSRVLSFSETLEAVSHTSTAPEVLRGLGHWLNYINAHTAIATTSAIQYSANHTLMASGFVLVIAALAGAALVRSRYVTLAMTFVFVGLVLSIGVHPIEDSAPIFRPLANNSGSFMSLALRSSTRAIPMMLLGLAMCIALALDYLRRHVRFHDLAAFGFVVLIGYNFAPLRNADLFDSQMERSASLPHHILEAADFLNAQKHNGRVLIVPGSEFGVFDWGYTMDPPQVGFLDQPIITRDLLPLGGNGAMDLFFALDDRLQTGNATPEMVAATARLLGVSDIWLATDHKSSQYNTVEPREVENLLSAAPGITEEFRRDGVVLYSVSDSPGLASIRNSLTVVDGSGDGLVGATANSQISGTEATVYASSYDDAALVELIAAADRFLVTDSNRAEARQWSGSRDTRGATESVDGTRVVAQDPPNDERFDLFANRVNTTRTQSLVSFIGPTRATASGYGSRLKYQPEYRPSRALDGDSSTAWRVGDQGNPIGDFISISATKPFSSVRLVQPIGDGEYRWITGVSISSPNGLSMRIPLNESSRRQSGQLIQLGQSTQQIVITIDQVDWTHEGQIDNLNGVGFAEIDTGLGATVETLEVPSRLSSYVAASRLGFSFERQRVRATDSWRHDPETILDRTFKIGSSMTPSFAMTGGFNTRLTDNEIKAIFGTTTTASNHLVGDLKSAAWAATDGDPKTSWKSADGIMDATLNITADGGGDRITISTDESLSRVRQLLVQVNDQKVRVPVDAGGDAVAAIPYKSGDVIQITAVSTERRTVLDSRTGRRIRQGYGIKEVSGVGINPRSLKSLKLTCTRDLLSLDGTPVAVTLRASVDDILSGNQIEIAPCDQTSLSAGTHRMTGMTYKGFTVDYVSMGETASRAVYSPLDITGRNSHRVIHDTTCDRECILVFSESFNDQWHLAGATADHFMVDGGFNGWFLQAGSYPDLKVDFGPQRYVDLGILVSLFACLTCAAIVLRTRRIASSPIQNSGATSIGLSYAVAGSLLVVVAFLTISLTYALLASAVVVVFALPPLVDRRRRIPAFALAALSAEFLLILARYIRRDPRPGPDWPLHVESFHRGVLFAVLMITWGAYLHTSDNRIETGILTDGGDPSD